MDKVHSLDWLAYDVTICDRLVPSLSKNDCISSVRGLLRQCRHSPLSGFPVRHGINQCWMLIRRIIYGLKIDLTFDAHEDRFLSIVPEKG
jgi:hypothetical protein